MLRRWLGCPFVLSLLALGGSGEEGGIRPTFLDHPTAPERKVELYVVSPQAEGKRPANPTARRSR
jgi:hypothetical protein